MTEAETERAAVVAWLRGQQAKGFASAQAAETEKSKRNFTAGAIAIWRAADAIEAGEHLTNEGK